MIFPSAPNWLASIQSPVLNKRFELICRLETNESIVSLNTSKRAVKAPKPLIKGVGDFPNKKAIIIIVPKILFISLITCEPLNVNLLLTL